MLDRLSPGHRAALTLRYLDDLRWVMTDAERPFRGLVRPTPPVEPDPAFASALRYRLRRALLQFRPTTPQETPCPR